MNVQFYLEDNMLDLIDDIENALQHNCLRVALGMALTLPDICGQVEHPKLNVGERYTKWCDRYLKNQGFITIEDSADKVISGNIYYKLRCAYLHSGNLELNQREKDDFPEFRLLMCNKEDKDIYCEPLHKNLQDKDLIITIDVRHMIQVICNAAKEYYGLYENKDDFKNHHILIEDVEEISNIVQTAKQVAFDIISKKKDKTDPRELSENTKNLLNNPKLLKESFDSANIEERINAMVASCELCAGGFIDFDKINNKSEILYDM